MRRYFCLVVVLLSVYPVSAQAFTIRYSALRKIFAPQLSTLSQSLSATTSISDFFLGSNVVETVLSGASVGTTSIKDVVYDYYAPGSIESKCSVFVLDSGNTPQFSSVNPSIATIDSVGSTTYVSAGTAYFNARLGRRTKTIPCTFSRTNNTPSYVFNTIVSTSTIKNIKDQVDTRISGKTPSSTTYNLFSSTDDTTHTYTRNTNLYASDVDFTCIPTYSVNSGTQVMGVLAAPDIMIQANHSHTSGTIYFVKNDNTTISRSITSGMNISGTDIWVARLDSDVPSGITPCKILPSNAFTNAISTTSLTYVKPPIVFTNQFRTLKVGTISYGTNSPFSQNINIIKGSGTYSDWYSAVVGGDSGSPIFALINGQAILLGVWHTSNQSTFSDFPNLSGYISQINSAITALGSSNSLSTVSLSGFPSF